MKLKKKKSNESYQTEESKRENKAEGRHVIAAKRAKKKKRVELPPDVQACLFNWEGIASTAKKKKTLVLQTQSHEQENKKMKQMVRKKQVNYIVFFF